MRHKKQTPLLLVLAIVLLILAVAGCGGGNRNSSNPTTSERSQSYGNTVAVADVLTGKYGSRLQKLMQLPDWDNIAVEKIEGSMTTTATYEDLLNAVANSQKRVLGPRSAIKTGERSTSGMPFPYAGWQSLGQPFGKIITTPSLKADGKSAKGQYRILDSTAAFTAADAGKFIGPDVTTGSPNPPNDDTKKAYLRIGQPKHPGAKSAAPFGADANQDTVEDVIALYPTKPLDMSGVGVPWQKGFVFAYYPRLDGSVFLEPSVYSGLPAKTDGSPTNPKLAYAVCQTTYDGEILGETSYVINSPADDTVWAGTDNYYKTQIGATERAAYCSGAIYEAFNSLVWTETTNLSGGKDDNLYYSDIMLAPIAEAEAVTTLHNPSYERKDLGVIETKGRVQKFYRDANKFPYLRWNYAAEITSSNMPEIQNIASGKDPRSGQIGYPRGFTIVGGIAWAWEAHAKLATLDRDAYPWNSALGLPVAAMEKVSAAIKDPQRRDLAGSPRIYTPYRQFFEGGYIIWRDFADGSDAAEVLIYNKANVFMTGGSYTYSQLNIATPVTNFDNSTGIFNAVDFGWGGNTPMRVTMQANSGAGLDQQYGYLRNVAADANAILMAFPSGGNGKFTDIIWNWGDGTISFNGGSGSSKTGGYAGGGNYDTFWASTVQSKSFPSVGLFKPRVMVIQENKADYYPYTDQTKALDEFYEPYVRIAKLPYSILQGSATAAGLSASIAIVTATSYPTERAASQVRVKKADVDKLADDIINAGYTGFDKTRDIYNFESATSATVSSSLRNYKLLIWMLPQGAGAGDKTLTTPDRIEADDQIILIKQWLMLPGNRSLWVIGDGIYGNWRVSNWAGFTGDVDSYRSAAQWTTLGFDRDILGLAEVTIDSSQAAYTQEKHFLSGNILNNWKPVLPDPGPMTNVFQYPGADKVNAANALYGTLLSPYTAGFHQYANYLWGSFDYYSGIYLNGTGGFYTSGMRTGLKINGLNTGNLKKGCVLNLTWSDLSYKNTDMISQMTEKNSKGVVSPMSNILVRYILAMDSTLKPGNTNADFVIDSPDGKDEVATPPLEPAVPAPASVKLLGAYAWNYSADGSTKRQGGSGRDLFNNTAGNYTDSIIDVNVGEGGDSQHITYECWFRAGEDDVKNGRVKNYVFWFYHNHKEIYQGTQYDYNFRETGVTVTKGNNDNGSLTIIVPDACYGNIDLENNDTFTNGLSDSKYSGALSNAPGGVNWATYFKSYDAAKWDKWYTDNIQTPGVVKENVPYMPYFVRAEIGREASWPMAGTAPNFATPATMWDGDNDPYDDTWTSKLGAGDYHPTRTYIRAASMTGVNLGGINRNLVAAGYRANELHGNPAISNNAYNGRDYLVYSKYGNELYYPADYLNAQTGRDGASDLAKYAGGWTRPQFPIDPVSPVGLADYNQAMTFTGKDGNNYRWYCVVNGDPRLSKTNNTNWGSKNQLYEFNGAVVKIQKVVGDVMLSDNGGSELPGTFNMFGKPDDTDVRINWSITGGSSTDLSINLVSNDANNNPGFIAGTAGEVDYGLLWFLRDPKNMGLTPALIGKSVVIKAAAKGKMTAFTTTKDTYVPGSPNWWIIPPGQWILHGIAYDDIQTDYATSNATMWGAGNGGAADNINGNLNGTRQWGTIASPIVVSATPPSYPVILVRNAGLTTVNNASYARIKDALDKIFGTATPEYDDTTVTQAQLDAAHRVFAVNMSTAGEGAGMGYNGFFSTNFTNKLFAAGTGSFNTKKQGVVTWIRTVPYGTTYPYGGYVPYDVTYTNAYMPVYYWSYWDDGSFNNAAANDLAVAGPGGTITSVSWGNPDYRGQYYSGMGSYAGLVRDPSYFNEYTIFRRNMIGFGSSNYTILANNLCSSSYLTGISGSGSGFGANADANFRALIANLLNIVVPSTTNAIPPGPYN